MVTPKPLDKFALEIEAEKHVKIEDELIFPTESVVKFPSTVGLTGQIFKTGGMMFTNQFKQTIRMDDPSQMFFGDGWEQPQIGSMASGLENHSKARAAMSQQSM